MAIKSRDPKRRPAPEAKMEDTAMLSLSRRDRKKLGMDSWEPSLLRKLLTAQNKLRNRE